MKQLLTILAVVSLFACDEQGTRQSHHDLGWTNRVVAKSTLDSLESASSYLSIYSQINSFDRDTKQGLTVTVSMRNIYDADTLYLSGIKSYDTAGELLHTYLTSPIYLLPLETLEIIIDEEEEHGGTGGNFIFDWQAGTGLEPFFEAVMIRSSGQQGISFTTRGIRRDKMGE
ncbi:DUF3124 domain-containing protein [Reichenbachiella agarivorans]|uniref:DUF3124 domain-containing protein n=1 Tax=Reichenbachiella agarivorans TaxID=2979464 RepID=A0ABY6CRE3_9BACT|nr:DUF3124 domain-containing protein [Reichenbachiella agarivorans]UXP33077.1 DUF3124 domain-containing protein [Reichenbachiella agarivorans]